MRRNDSPFPKATMGSTCTKPSSVPSPLRGNNVNVAASMRSRFVHAGAESDVAGEEVSSPGCASPSPSSPEDPAEMASSSLLTMESKSSGATTSCAPPAPGNSSSKTTVQLQRMNIGVSLESPGREKDRVFPFGPTGPQAIALR
ncbi:hypothetical protein COEX109129_36085 [Corallococcus exiguus]